MLNGDVKATAAAVELVAVCNDNTVNRICAPANNTQDEDTSG